VDEVRSRAAAGPRFPPSFPTESAGFHNRLDLESNLLKLLFLGLLQAGEHSNLAAFALRDGLCYSNSVGSEQWSLPVAEEACPVEMCFWGKWEAGS
jgi:hypothetical protein